MIEYRKGSLFEAPEDSILVHACNTMGIWGAGIARYFRENYPKSHERYKQYCRLDGSHKDIRGEFFYTGIFDEKHRVGCLMTSKSYGLAVDPPDVIIVNTVLAVEQAMIFASREARYNHTEEEQATTTIYSNKFNSGLFNVPWEKTETVINVLLEKYPRVRWVVYEV